MKKFNYMHEIYVPDKYVDENGKLVNLDMETHMQKIAKTLASHGISGFSVRTEEGYYVHSNGSVNKTNNHIVYFYSEEYYGYYVNEIADYIMKNMHQETVLIRYCNMETKSHGTYMLDKYD